MMYAHLFDKVEKFNPNHDERGRFATGAAGGGGSVIFASPNRHEGNQSIDTAAGRVHSKEQTALKSVSRKIDNIVGITGKVHDALGAWADGAENSTVSQYEKGTYQQVLVASAMRGYLGEQKAVIAFKTGDGPSRLNVWESKSHDVAALNKELVKAGLEYHTLIPTSKGTRIMVWETKKDAATLHRARAMAGFHGSHLTSISGHGQMLGSWDSREEGRKAYQRVIKNWAQRNPDAGKRWDATLASWKFGANKSLKDRL
jgi:hypothetical protein